MSKETKEPKDLKKSVSNKKTTTKTTTTKKDTISKSKKGTTKKVATSKIEKEPTKKATTKSSRTKKSTSTKKETTKTNAAAKKSTTNKKVTSAQKKEKVEIVEYYDLPYRYNQTVVKLLAQTPTSLFVYWDISDEDKKNLETKYGENFFNDTHPILIVHNDTLGYSFEVEINDFANSWYLHVADSKCDYRIELGRRPNVKNEKINQDYFYVSTSNKIEAPNDKILLDKNQKMVYFRNVKNGNQSERPFASFSFMQNIGKIYDIYDIYKELYHTENIEGIYDKSNPSS